ncbi:MAG TPA: amino acid ABC transporter permease [Sediminispirochaeta sp.]|nr:amino acid ABC transporter permease [Sediminispirochaeta sp.]
MDNIGEFVYYAAIAIGKGALVTVSVTVASLILGFVLAVPLAIGRTYGNRPVQFLIQLYEGFFRGTPHVVTLFIFYFGLRQVGNLFGAPEFQIALPPFPAAILALGITSSAYQSLIFRSTIQSISRDQYNAARSLGMGKWQAIFGIVFVQALRLSIPGLTNEATIVLKDSPITYLVAIPEMLTQARGIIDSAMGRVFFEVLIPVSIIYYLLFYFSNRLFLALDKKLRIPGFETDQR